MNDGKRDRLGDTGEFELLEELGRWTREQGEAEGEPLDPSDEVPAFEGFPDDRIDALVDRALQIQDESQRPIGELLEPAANDRGRLSWVAPAAAAVAAIVGTFAIVTPRSGPRTDLEVTQQAPAATGPAAPAIPTAPPFASVRIDGGGPPPSHQGPASTTEPPRICQDRPMQLTLAVTRGQPIDPAMPLELTLEATPPWGPSHRFVYDVSRDERWQWSDDGQALVFSGTLDRLAALTPGRWTLRIDAGAPGACSVREPGSGCSSMKVRNIEVVSAQGCDATP